MKKLLYVLLASIALPFLGWSFQLPAPGPAGQSSARLIPMDDSGYWYEVHNGAGLSPAALLRASHAALGLGPGTTFRLTKVQQDALGMKHYRFQQYHDGIKVAGAQLLVHTRGGAPTMLNGRWAKGLGHQPVSAVLTEAQAVRAALRAVPAQRYSWESWGAERMLKRITGNPDTSFYPQPELVWAWHGLSKGLSSPRLAYRMTVQAQQPQMREGVYLDAYSGGLLLQLNLLHTQNTPAQAETKYSGQRAIVTDSVGTDSFRLVETTRGGGIETYNLRKREDVEDAVDFWDEDNYWDNFNANQDEVATDAHWGAEMTFDYFAEKHNYIGVDGDSMPLISYVHFGNNVVNAFWNGSWSTFGDGNNSTFSSLATMDVVAHEFVHGITQNTAGLIYQDESGALNESFSDIFGAVVEFYATPELADWTIAEDADLQSDGFRNMADPGQDGHPDTYLGSRWFDGSGDNGGVHTNSGVQNHWFYLLTEGGAGTNDNMDTFSVDGLGLDTAAAIAFRNLQFYLTELSGYHDARIGSILAAEDLYGPCSFEVAQATAAWQAVGVGEPFAENDLRPLALLNVDSLSCGFPEDGLLEISLAFESCNSSLAPGTPIPLAFQVNGGAVFADTLFLPAALQHQDTLSFAFSAPAAALAAPANHEVRIWSALAGDNISQNDTLVLRIDNILAQNVDLKTGNVGQPGPGCFLGDEAVAADIVFLGCDSIAAGEPLTVSYRLNGGAVVSEAATVPQTLYRGQAFTHVFQTQASIPVQRANSFDVWVSYGPDYLNANDTLLQWQAPNPIPVEEQGLLTFEGAEEALDSFFVLSGEGVAVGLTQEAAATGGLGLQITGTNSYAAYEQGQFILPGTNDEIWQLNADYGAEVCLCADLSQISDPVLTFDFKQSWSPVFLSNQVPGSSPRVCAMRLLVDGEPLGGVYIPESLATGPFENKMADLSAYEGQQVEICFETRTGMGKAFDPFNRGDNILLDNIRLGAMTLNTGSTAEVQRPIVLSPNPGSAQLSVRIAAQSTKDAVIEVYNLQGQQVASHLARLSSGVSEIALDAAAWPAGQYLVQVILNEGRHTLKWVKQ